MIYRFMFVGYSENIPSIKITADERYYVALSYKGNKVFMYVEANEEEINPELLAEGELIAFPDGRKWERAYDIFHSSRPVSEEQWKRKVENKTPRVRLNQLKPEKVASYIFYHYQYQEEMPGREKNKYGIIFLYRDELIYYQELPRENETEKLEGALQTNHSPVDRWSELMKEHFADTWREIENLEFTNYIKF